MLRKIFPVTRPGIDTGTLRLVAQRLNHYATPGPIKGEVWQIIRISISKCGILTCHRSTETSSVGRYAFHCIFELVMSAQLLRVIICNNFNAVNRTAHDIDKHYIGNRHENIWNRIFIAKNLIIVTCAVLKSRSVTTCTTRFSIQKFCILPTKCIHVFFYGFQNKQRLFLYTGFYNRGR